MVQSPAVRLVTEEALEERLDVAVPDKLDRSKLRLLGDQFDGVRPNTKVPTTKAVVSLTTSAVDGYVATAGTVLEPAQMYDVAECNWSAQTLGAYNTAWLNYSKANNIATSMDFTTIFDGTAFLLSSYKLAGIKQDIRVWIDDEEVHDWYLGSRATGVLQNNKPVIPCATDSSFYFLNINFPQRGRYKIRISGVMLASSAGIGYIATSRDGKFYKPAKQRVFGVISDSWYDTISAHTSLNAGHELAARMGWKQWNMSVGGSGFVNPTTNSGGPMNYGSDAVFNSLLKAPPLDFLLLNGSDNDMAYPVADVIAAMQAFFTRWRTVRPDTPIVWQGLEPQSYFENQYGSAAIVAREEALRAVAVADPSVIAVVLPAKENWLTGTGNTTTPNNTGNQDYYTGPDLVHLSPAGAIHNGVLMSERLKSVPTWKVAA